MGKDTIIIIYFLSVFTFFSFGYSVVKLKMSPNAECFVSIEYKSKVVEYMHFNHAAFNLFFLFLTQ